MYLITTNETDDPYPDSTTADAAAAIQLAEEASRRHAGVLVRAWEAELGSELGPTLVSPPLAEFRDGKRLDIGG